MGCSNGSHGIWNEVYTERQREKRLCPIETMDSLGFEFFFFNRLIDFDKKKKEN